MSNNNGLTSKVKELYNSLPDEVRREVDVFSWYRMDELIKSDPIAALLTILAVVGIRYIEPLIMLKESELKLRGLLENKLRVKLVTFRDIEYEGQLRKLMVDGEVLKLIDMYLDIMKNKTMLNELIIRVRDNFWRKYLEGILIGREGG